jgi:5-methylcytosine-specific restriction protein A
MPTRPPQHKPHVTRRLVLLSPSARYVHTAAWQKLRMAVLVEEPLCRECQRHGRISAAVTVDHITPREQGGGNDRGNLQPLCRACHQAKTSREQAERNASASGHGKGGIRNPPSGR